MKILKKMTIPSLMFVCVLLVTMFTITTCDNGLNATPSTEGKDELGPGDTGPINTTLLQAEPTPASSSGTPKVLDSYTDGTNNFYI
jgi:hypothetical protein